MTALAKIGRWLVAAMLIVAVRLLRATWRVRFVGSPPTEPTLLALWHGDQLALTHLPRPMGVLVSRSTDGDLAARVLHSLGFDVVRGSTSRGAVAGALGLVRLLRQGRSVAVTVDGPRGPRHVASDAAARLALCAGVRVVPVVASARRFIRLSSWDRMLIPAPFTTIRIAWGEVADAEIERRLGALWRQTSSCTW